MKTLPRTLMIGAAAVLAVVACGSNSARSREAGTSTTNTDAQSVATGGLGNGANLGSGGVSAAGGIVGEAGIPPADASAAEVSPDVRLTCADATCGTGQACVLLLGGAIPSCEPTMDAGVCREGLVPVDSCSVGGGPLNRQPGCTTPPDRPKCYDLPDTCEDVCSCICQMPSHQGCYPGPGYLVCSRP